MHSVGLVNLHFWLATLGVVFYAASMWIAGVMQGLMWRAVNEDGTLTYSFVQSLEATWPYYVGPPLRRPRCSSVGMLDHGLQRLSDGASQLRTRPKKCRRIRLGGGVDDESRDPSRRTSAHDGAGNHRS